MGHILVMGVSGVGKSTVAQALAGRLGVPFIDADSYHSPENIASLAGGRPLTDAMRHGWLDRVAGAAQAQGASCVIACSALKQDYRDRLSAALGRLTIVHLTGARDLLAARIAGRKDHFMPVSLLDSQFADLEEPSGPHVCRIDVAHDRTSVIAAAIEFVTAPQGDAREA